MTNGVSSRVPYAGYPHNAVGATNTTKDIASYCFDTQRNSIQRTTDYLLDDSKPSYTWPVIGTVVSTLSLLILGLMKR